MRKITKISNRIIRRFDPCYDPSELGSKESECLPVVEAVEKYRDKCKKKEDVLWLLCRPEFMTDRDLRLFAVWCAREALKLLKNPDQRSIDACDVAEKFANGEATIGQLSAAWAEAMAADRDAARDADWAADAARAAVRAAARAAAWAADRDADVAADWAAAEARAADRDADVAADWAAAEARAAARAAVRAAAAARAWDAARAADAAWDAQIDKLLTYFLIK